MNQVQKLSHEIQRTSSAPRLSYSHIDVFNLRNQQLSHSSPGLYCTEKPSTDPKQKTVIVTTEKSQSMSSIAKIKESQESVALLLEAAGETQKVVKEEKEERKVDFSLLLELQFTAFVLLCFIIVIVVPVSMIVIGSIYIFDCPAQVFIPIFLIVCGSSILVSIVFLTKLSKRTVQMKADRLCYIRTLAILMLFQIGWFVAGCYWIYSIYEPDYAEESSSSYCHRTLYQYSFWLLNAIFLSVGLSSILFAIYILFGTDNNVEAVKV